MDERSRTSADLLALLLLLGADLMACDGDEARVISVARTSAPSAGAVSRTNTPPAAATASLGPDMSPAPVSATPTGAARHAPTASATPTPVLPDMVPLAPFSVDVSPDNHSVCAAGDGGLAWFERDADTGELSLRDVAAQGIGDADGLTRLSMSSSVRTPHRSAP